MIRFIIETSYTVNRDNDDFNHTIITSTVTGKQMLITACSDSDAAQLLWLHAKAPTEETHRVRIQFDYCAYWDQHKKNSGQLPRRTFRHRITNEVFAALEAV